MQIREVAREFAHKLVAECEELEEGLPVPIIPYSGDDEELHTDDYPFCGDRLCPCNNSEARQELRKQEWNGLMTSEERLRLYYGRNI